MIERQLTERFHTVLEDEPPLGFDPDELVDEQRRGRRRQAALAGAVVTAAAAVVAVGVVGLSSDERLGPAQQTDPPVERSAVPADPDGQIVSFESRIGGTQEVTPDPAVYEVNGRLDPPPVLDHVSIESFLVDSYPGDRGVLQIRRGDEVLFQVQLGDHDNYAMHLTEPWNFTPEEPLRVAVSCHQAGSPGGTCEAGVTFTGVAMYP